MFFITCESHTNGILTAGAGETLSDAWENLAEMLDMQGEVMPDPNQVLYHEGKAIIVNSKVTFEIEKQ
jgi:hypothetical protein